jgi:hypothetical protein
LTDFRTNRLPELSRKAHEYERTGVEYWKMKLGEEVSELDKMQTEINALREQVRELVSSQSPIIRLTWKNTDYRISERCCQTPLIISGKLTY